MADDAAAERGIVLWWEAAAVWRVFLEVEATMVLSDLIVGVIEM